jgi:hypothetical protein
MKNSRIMRSLAAMSLVIALCTVGSQAAQYLLPTGSFMVFTHRGGICENPNGFPVVTVSAPQLANGTAGFLLDGSESASNWLKTLQDACLNNRRIGIYTDDNWDHAYCGQLSEAGYTGGAYKIVAIYLVP